MDRNEGGYTLVELLGVIIVLSIMALATFDLFTSLLHSAIVATRQTVALTLASNQMEYLKSLPYDNLAVAGGPISSATTIPGTATKKVNGSTYTVTTSIRYVDDAYDGCGSYTSLTIEEEKCANYPPPAGAPTDNNPADYKDVNVKVTDASGVMLAQLDTHIAALVAETASNTGSLIVKVIDSSGNPVSGATVNAANSSVSPAVNVSDTTDENGLVIFYDLPPSTSGYHYQITASKSGYSSLVTIPPSGSLQPTYPSQNLIAQSSSYVTMTINQQGQDSLVVETTDTSGNPLPNASIYIKGGYKKYTASTDTSYCYDNMIASGTTTLCSTSTSTSDNRLVTDSSGLGALASLAPGGYYFCGDDGSSSCSVGGTKYYLAAAVPYGGSSPLEPVSVPTYDPANPPGTTYTYGTASDYLQKVRLMLTTNSAFPRVTSLTPYNGSLSGGALSSFSFSLTGTNIPCDPSAASCATSVSFTESGTNYPASCTGSTGSATQTLSCSVDLSNASAGNTQLVVSANGYTLTLPAAPMIGGIVVSP